jgi:ATP-binding cassette subfamily F protein 3
VVWQAREKQLSKMEEEGLVADPDARQDGATIRLHFPEPPPLRRPSLVEMSDVSFGYPAGGEGAAAGRPLLEGVSLQVSLGSRIGILGRNGCGKSTLLKLMTEQLAPSSGRLTLNRAARSAIFAQHFVDSLDLSATAVECDGGHLLAWWLGEYHDRQLVARRTSAALSTTCLIWQVPRRALPRLEGR